MSAHQLADNRALLATVRHRRVRAVAAEDSQYATALFEVVKQRSREWTSETWTAALAELDASAMTVEQFLQAEHGGRAP